MMIWLLLLIWLLLILLAAEIFVNALEHLGEKLGISEGVTGSIFAAIGTALPETLVPLIAIFGGHGNQDATEIGTGAILGAPLMLSTLSVSLMGLAVLRKRKLTERFQPEPSGLKRDLNVFLAAFIIASASMFVPHDNPAIRAAMAFTMVLMYFIYLMLTLKASSALVNDGHATAADSVLWLARLGFSPHLWIILLQLAGALALLAASANGFIHAIHTIAPILGINPLLLSLLIVPIATELPEKINSIVWIRRNKDTLAFGNITGALAFQGTLLPAIGIGLTPWTAQPALLTGLLITLGGAAWLRLCLATGGIRVWQLSINGGLYLLYLGLNLTP